jgi:hypothetical protein
MNPSIRPRASSEMRNVGVSDEIASSQGSPIVETVRVPARNKCLIAECAMVSVVVTTCYADSVRLVYDATPNVRVDPSHAGEKCQPVSLSKPAAKCTNVLQAGEGW